MALKKVRRVTFSLPKVTLQKLELHVPKKKRSKFLAELIEKQFSATRRVTLEDVHEYWDGFSKRYPRKGNKTAVESLREDRTSH